MIFCGAATQSGLLPAHSTSAQSRCWPAKLQGRSSFEPFAETAKRSWRRALTVLLSAHTGKYFGNPLHYNQVPRSQRQMRTETKVWQQHPGQSRRYSFGEPNADRPPTALIVSYIQLLGSAVTTCLRPASDCDRTGRFISPEFSGEPGDQ